MTKRNFLAPLKRALEQHGSYRNLAERVGVSHTAIRYHVQKKEEILPSLAIAIEQVTDIDRLEFIPEILRGQLGKQIMATVQKNNKKLWGELVARRIV